MASLIKRINRRESRPGRLSAIMHLSPKSPVAAWSPYASTRI